MRIPHSDPDSEARWAALVAQRDVAYRIARARGATPHDAEDCVQEALTRVAAMQDVDLDRLRGLLAVVVTRLVIDSHRRRERERLTADRARAVQPEARQPEDVVCDAAAARWLWEHRTVLPQRERRALELRAQGSTVADVAAALEVTYKAAENILGRARAGMRAAARATAGVLGLAWVQRARPRAVALTATPAALALALAVTLAPNGPAPAEGTLPRPAPLLAASPGPSVPPAQRAARHAQVLPSPRVPPLAPANTRPPAAEPSRGPSPRLPVPGVTGGPLSWDGTHGEVDHEEETFQQTLERCLREGWTITLQHIECRG